MLEEAMLAEQFQSLLQGQRHASRLYSDVAGRVEDPACRERIEQILRDKQRHIILTERLLEILQA